MTTTCPIIEAADHAARRWSDAYARRIRRGDDEHRTMFARMLLDTLNPYKPAVIDWPKLDPEARQRLITLPIWGIAVQTEGHVRLRILSYARAIQDKVLREAFELTGFEEGRHKRIGVAKDVSSGEKEDANFTVQGASAVSGVDIKAAELMEICLAENDRRLAGYDARLLRPTTVPRLVRFARRFMPMPRAAALAS